MTLSIAPAAPATTDRARRPGSRPGGALAALLRCPGCSSRDLVDATQPTEDDSWWATMLCRSCGHEWIARS
ncbi:hypothetical protein GCM10023328_15250 [Modestobacter marinus]|uniref:Transcription elongation factor Elf1 n=1 Tax=Modestobacter marinus TaxID=477641 RepID=A0A846LN27_9ACTN|nr:hypothetical protein [Modestobacter marinus]NIH68841.1 transcription elongation factor Elf1 [Modestobacter marinus]GGL60429.1 hypothetical protein GCM10011589_15620 [Modestobacter marinus]